MNFPTTTVLALLGAGAVIGALAAAAVPTRMQNRADTPWDGPVAATVGMPAHRDRYVSPYVSADAPPFAYDAQPPAVPAYEPLPDVDYAPPAFEDDYGNGTAFPDDSYADNAPLTDPTPEDAVPVPASPPDRAGVAAAAAARAAQDALRAEQAIAPPASPESESTSATF